MGSLSTFVGAYLLHSTRESFPCCVEDKVGGVIVAVPVFISLLIPITLKSDYSVLME
jgi:hypothetical protein